MDLPACTERTCVPPGRPIISQETSPSPTNRPQRDKRASPGPLGARTQALTRRPQVPVPYPRFPGYAPVVGLYSLPDPSQPTASPVLPWGLGYAPVGEFGVASLGEGAPGGGFYDEDREGKGESGSLGRWFHDGCGRGGGG